MDTKPTHPHQIPVGIDIAAAWSWRLLLIMAVIGVVTYGLSKILVLWLPLVVAAFLAGLLNPVVDALVRHGVSRVFATIITFAGAIAGFSWLMTIVVEQLVKGFEGIWDQVLIAANDLETFLTNTTRQLPITFPDLDLNAIGTEIAYTIQENSSSLVGQVANISSGASSAITVVIIALFACFFFMLQGRQIWQFLLTLMPKDAQGAINAGAERGWIGVVSFVRFQAGIAILEGIWIGLAAWLLGLPLALPLGLFVLLGAMVPILGALITGIVAVLLSFATGGLFAAFVMAVAVIGINQLETVLLQPWLMGRAVNLHPLVILMSVIGGASIADLVGALIAVPFMAFSVAAVYGIRDYFKQAETPDEPTTPAFVPYG